MRCPLPLRAAMAAAPLLLAGPAAAKDVPVPPTDYRLFYVPASRGLERQCAALTEPAALQERLAALGVSKPAAVVAKIAPPIDWQSSGVLLLYQPDPPPDVVPTVRSLLKDINKEKFTILFRYVDPNQPPPPAPAAADAPKATVATAFTLKAVTVGTDDTRDRAGTRSPLLLIVVPRLGFLSSKSLVECTQKL